MLTHGTCSQLVAVVREELNNNVAPRVQDDVARVALGMVDSVLQQVVNRLDDEPRWMAEEIRSVRSFAADLSVAAGSHHQDLNDLTAEVDRHWDSTTVGSAELRDAYDAATRLLCRCVQIADELGGEFSGRAEEILRHRLTTELTIRGPFSFTR